MSTAAVHNCPNAFTKFFLTGAGTPVIAVSLVSFKLLNPVSLLSSCTLFEWVVLRITANVSQLNAGRFSGTSLAAPIIQVYHFSFDRRTEGLLAFRCCYAPCFFNHGGSMNRFLLHCQSS